MYLRTRSCTKIKGHDKVIAFKDKVMYKNKKGHDTVIYKNIRSLCLWTRSCTEIKIVMTTAGSCTKINFDAEQFTTCGRASGTGDCVGKLSAANARTT